MVKKIAYICFVALILILCLIPSLGMLAGPEAEAGGNQILTPLPRPQNADGNWNADYLSQLGDYLQDHFFLRQAMISAWSEGNALLLRSSAADGVVLGKDGWLYYRDTLDDYTGSGLMSDGEILSAAHDLALVNEFCESQGAKFLFTVAPNKNSLYPEHMPDLTVFSSGKNADRLAAALADEGVPYLDLFALLGGEEETLYFTQDSHWNSKGAALAADALNRALGRSSDYYSGPFSAQPVHRSDLYEMLSPAGGRMEDDQVYGGQLTFDYESPIRSAEDITIRTTGQGDGSLLLFRDSFGNLLYPYLADSFGSALFSRSTAYRLDFIAQRSAGYVVVELVERNLDYLLQNVPQMPAPERRAPETAASGNAVSLTAGPAQFGEGFVQLSGALPAEPDPGAPVYLLAGETCYEAFRLENGGFGLVVPEGAAAEKLSVLYQINSVWTAADAVTD